MERPRLNHPKHEGIRGQVTAKLVLPEANRYLGECNGTTHGLMAAFDPSTPEALQTFTHTTHSK